MDARQYEEAVAQLAAWNARDKDYQRQLKEHAAAIESITNARRSNKAQYGALLAQTQAYEKAHAGGKVRRADPNRPGVVIEQRTVHETVEVEKPLSWARALKKVCGLG